jgi:glyoxylase-like metal-dependent hydrolase (beta-lactamase superfamily II)
MKRVTLAIALLIVVGLVALGRSFAPATLEVPPLAVDSLPRALPPKAMSISLLPTGSIQSSAALAFRGGRFGDEREFAVSAILVRHPRGNLLFDAGFGREVDEHVKALSRLMRLGTTYTKGTPAGDQLIAGGFKLGSLTAVVLTHSHWDHVSGLDSLPGAEVWMNEPEQAFALMSASPARRLLIEIGKWEVKAKHPVKLYKFADRPYLGFPSSHDVWDDGSVVLVPTPGHTPGSVIAFITLPSGRRYALLGDLVWQREGVTLPAERPWLVRRIIGEDDDLVRENLLRVAAIHKRFPEIILVPAHDSRAAAELPVFPAVER